MNTLHFKYAVEIEKTHSITQAAENLYMAQPNMSKAIKELENTLGITIFKRTSKGVIPTEQGVRFLEYAKQVLIQIDNMEAIHSPDKQQKQKLKISVPRSGYISAAFAEFTAGFDTSNDIESYLRETNAVQTISDVREQSYDFGIIRFNLAYEKYFSDFLAEKSLDSELIWEYEMLAVMSEDHPLAEKENLRYSDFSDGYTEIAYGDDSVPYTSHSGFPEASSGKDDKSGIQRLFVFDRGSCYDFVSAIPRSFMLDSPIPPEICRRYGLIQRKCAFDSNKYCDLLIRSSAHRLSEQEIQLVNKIFEVRNKIAFADFR